jgi:hypothetical protein
VWIILSWIFGREDGVISAGLIWLRMEKSGGLCEHGNKPIKFWEFLERLHN